MSYHGVQGLPVHGVVLLVLAISIASSSPAAVLEDPLVADDHEPAPALDAHHRQARRSVAAVAERLDRFFVDERIDEGRNETSVRLGSGIRISESTGIDPLFRFRLDLSLPRTERRAALVLGSIIDERAPDPIATDTGEEGSIGGFLRLFARDRSDSRITFDGGARLSPAPDPFVRLRGFREFAFGATLLRPTQQFFWRLSDGVGEQTRLDVDRRLSAHTLARLRTTATYSEATEGVAIDLAGLLFQRVSRGSAIRFEIGFRMFTDPPRSIESYRSSVVYRRAIYRHWLFVEVEPQVHFRRLDDYRFSPAILFRVETFVGPASALS